MTKLIPKRVYFSGVNRIQTLKRRIVTATIPKKRSKNRKELSSVNLFIFMYSNNYFLVNLYLIPI